MKLSYKQRGDLGALLDPNSHVRSRGCTNATLSALAKRGLVTLAFVPSEYGKDHTVPQWTITDAGRAALYPVSRPSPWRGRMKITASQLAIMKKAASRTGLFAQEIGMPVKCRATAEALVRKGLAEWASCPYPCNWPAIRLTYDGHAVVSSQDCAQEG